MLGIAHIVKPPYPAAILMLHGVQLLQALVNLRTEVRVERFRRAKTGESPANNGVGQGRAHNLLHAAIGVARQVTQAFHQASAHRARQGKGYAALPVNSGGTEIKVLN